MRYCSNDKKLKNACQIQYTLRVFNIMRVKAIKIVRATKKCVREGTYS